MVYKKLYSTSTHFYYYYAHRSHIHTFITIINSLHHYTSIPQGHPHLCVSSLEDKCTILWGYEYKLFCSQFSQAALVNLKTFLLLGFVFVYLKTFLLLGYTCVPQDIFNTTTTHRSHNHTFTTTIYSFYHLTSTQCRPLLFVSSLDNKCTILWGYECQRFCSQFRPVDVACERTYSLLGYDTSCREVQDHAFPEP